MYKLFPKVIPLFIVLLACLPGKGTDTPNVLMVVANQDFYWWDYILPRNEFEAAGLDVTVAAAQNTTAYPHAGAGSPIEPDLALADVDPDDYAAIMFVGGWGAASYQYAFEGNYHNAAYDGDPATKATVNQLILDFEADDKVVGYLCFAVSIYAHSRDAGLSPVVGQAIPGYPGLAPSFDLNGESFTTGTAWHLETNGGSLLPTGSVGDPTTASDDVLVMNNLVFGESYESATAFGQTMSTMIWDWWNNLPPLPVLMVIANQDFYYQEMGDTRNSLEAAGLEVHIAATTLNTSWPHAGTGEPWDYSGTEVDLTLSEASADDYSAILFVGGWGSAQFQYGFAGNYSHAPYNGDPATKAIVNDLIGDFIDQGKWITAICFGVTNLAWADYQGSSVLAGKDVVAYQWGSPACTVDGMAYGNNALPTTWHMSTNGANMLPSNSVGDPATDTDDVLIDTSNGINVITAQNYNSAAYFGTVVAGEILP